MISSEVEDRIARYFFHQYLPEDVRLEIVGKLLPFYLILNNSYFDFKPSETA